MQRPALNYNCEGTYLYTHMNILAMIETDCNTKKNKINEKKLTVAGCRGLSMKDDGVVFPSLCSRGCFYTVFRVSLYYLVQSPGYVSPRICPRTWNTEMRTR